MAKILFVPTNSREVTQFVPVKHELDRGLSWDILAIALNEKMELRFQEAGFSQNRTKDYKTCNLLNIAKARTGDGKKNA